MKKVLWILIPFALVLITCAKAEKKSSLSSDYPDAPEFTLSDLKGNEISLSDYQGDVIFLNFWATWCSPCRIEIPDFIEMYDKYKNKGMEILGISLDRVRPGKVLEFVEYIKINYPVVMGTKEIVDAYQTGPYIPVTIIIDKKGRIRHKHIGILNKETIEKYFLDLISEK